MILQKVKRERERELEASGVAANVGALAPIALSAGRACCNTRGGTTCRIF